MPKVPERVLSQDVTPSRARAIMQTEYKWMNGTILHYYFFDNPNQDYEEVILSDGSTKKISWIGDKKQADVVRKAFEHWKGVGIGLEFEEVFSREEAEIRIGFMEEDGSWSYIGTYNLKFGPNTRTMNFGWNLDDSNGFDTALHELGHALGLPHEHQNPNAGIVWDEQAVYAALSNPPNNWKPERTYHNIIRKLDPASVTGTDWDPDSIMHYPFEKHLIKQPAQYWTNGLKPKGGLSESDKAIVKRFYPPLKKEASWPKLMAGQSALLNIKNTEQQDFLIIPDATRYYNIRTFGACDTILALFEKENNEFRYRTADDDSGEDRNANLKIKLIRGHIYAIRVRLKYTDLSTPPIIMMW